MPSRTAFATLVLDVDSTVAGIEGIDWLAGRRGEEIAGRVAGLTRQAMSGELALEAVYEKRLLMVSPSLDDVAALAFAYIDNVAPGCREALTRIRASGVHIVLVTGSIRQALDPLAASLGVSDADVHAVSLRFNGDGGYAGFDPSPLTARNGKRRIVETGEFTPPILAVGDGVTDALMCPPADAFAAFTGFARREPVVNQADFECASFAEVKALIGL